MKKEIILKKAVKIIKRHLPDDYKIMLFGSWTKGDAIATSDLDIGILGKKEVSWDKLVKILDAIDKIPTLRSIDVVDLNAKSEDFKNNVLRYAQSLQ